MSHLKLLTRYELRNAPQTFALYQAERLEKTGSH